MTPSDHINKGYIRGSFRCWPKHWRDAAVEAGLGFRVLGETYIQLYDPTMMTALEIFAKHVQDNAPVQLPPLEEIDE